jgi:hypothetical protein
LIAVPLSILAKRSGKIAEFDVAGIEKNCEFVLKSTVRKRPKNSRKVAEFITNLK